MLADPIALLLGADSLPGSRSGVGRMTLEIARQLETHPDIADYGFLIDGRIQSHDWGKKYTSPDQASGAAMQPKEFRKGIKHLLGNVGPLRNLRLHMRRVKLNRAARVLGNGSAVLYHEPNMITSPYDGPSVATFNDLSWHFDPALHPPERLRWIGHHLPRVLKDSTRFVAISAFTADEVVRELGIRRDRIDVVPLAPAPEFEPVSKEAAAAILARHGLTDQSYILSVSTLEPRKNFDRLLAAYLGLPQHIRSKAPLVIAGGKGWGSVLKKADRAIAAGELRMLGYVPDEVLVALTARCTAFAYVSLYEGFGLPIIEAMATGAPVVASSTTAAGETAGDGASLIDPHDEAEIRRHLLLMLEEPEFRQKWREAGLRRSREFSWQRTADRLVSSWHSALGHATPVLETPHLLVSS